MRLKPIAFALVRCRLHQLSYDDLYIGCRPIFWGYLNHEKNETENEDDVNRGNTNYRNGVFIPIKI